MATQTDANCGGLNGVQPPPRDDMRAAAKEKNPLVANGEWDLIRDRGCHMHFGFFAR